MPSRMICSDGCAKHRRTRCWPMFASVVHSAPGLIATPDCSADCVRRVVSMASGNFTHKKIPPAGSSNSTPSPNWARSASISTSHFLRRVLRNALTWESKCSWQYSARIICSSAPEPPSFLIARMRLMRRPPVTRYPMRSAGAMVFENEPIWITRSSSVIARNALGRPPFQTRSA